MLAMRNTRLAGYMLTGNRSMFLDTDGTVVWLYHCTEFLSPLKVLDKCYDRIPILFERIAKFVDPIKRQTYYSASEIPCLGDYTNVFQIDLENDNSCYQLLPDPIPFNKLCCSSQLNLAILLSFLLLTLGLLECILAGKWKISGITSMLRLPTLS